MAQPAPPRTAPDSEFSRLAGYAIYSAGQFAPPEFALSPGSEAPVSFYGDALNKFQDVSCERRASFGMIAKANMAGAISVGICVRERQRVRALAASAQPALAGTLALLSQGGARFDPAMLDKAGWKYARSVGADGAEEHYFALIAVGHGIVALPTLVRIPRGARRAIVVQADLMRLCENYGLRERTVLCRDTRGALADIAQRLDARSGD
jgi:hypothetical protein